MKDLRLLESEALTRSGGSLWALLAGWLSQSPRDQSTFQNFDVVDLSERVPITPEVKAHISDLLRDAKVDPGLLRTAATTLGWPAAEAIFVAASQPSGDAARKGVLGEVLDAALLAELFGYQVPVKKHRFKVTPGQPLPSADILAVRVNNK